jgi:polyhydroxybutyrate depolymerase
MYTRARKLFIKAACWIPLVLAVGAADTTAQSLTFSAQQVPTAPGRYVRMLEHAGLARGYTLQIPHGYHPSRPAPLLFVFHGRGQSMRSFSRRHPDLFREADAAGFLLVLGNATPDEEGRRRWVQPAYDAAGVDDPGFVLSLLARLGSRLAVDARRIYAAGFSNGGGFTHFMGATYPRVFAAMTVCASGMGHAVTLRAPTPILLVYGRRDTSRPYEGGYSDAGHWRPSVPEVAAGLAAENGCDPAPLTRTAPGRTVDRYAPPVGDAEVILVTLDRMDHAWPDAADGWGFDLNRAVFAFCQRHRN